MSKHTPGPWADDSTLPPSARSVIARTCRGLPISGNWNGPITQKQDDANAHLIAAAPDLLEACKNFAYGRKDSRECEAEMHDAIRKAEGRQ